ncbi:MAG: hypothetical protein FVQ78_05420 [Solirubrobacterales bacterium]|nr:hypothetical protein [Solirubrobacterales bacterium]
MRLGVKIALVTGALALGASPGLAVAMHDGNSPHGKGAANAKTPGPKAGLPAKAKAYGRYCRGTSKKHVKGEKGTEFSRCVTAMAKAAKNERMNPRKACRGLSKKHVKGEKGTEFSRCVKAAAKLRRR